MVAINRVGTDVFRHGQEPLGFAAGDANLYRYVGNSPTNYTDPSGLDRITMTTGGNGKILLWYVSEKWLWRGDVKKKFIGALKYVNGEEFVSRGDRLVPLAKVRNEVEEAFRTTSDWSQWFKDNHVDVCAPSGKNLSIEMGAWSSTHNDFAAGTEKIKELAWTAIEWSAGAGFNAMPTQAIEATVTARRAGLARCGGQVGVSGVRGQTSGTVLTDAQLSAFIRNMLKRGADVVTDPAVVARVLKPQQGAGFAAPGVAGVTKPTIFLRPGATRYQVLHEWLHLIHYARDAKAYKALSEVDKERFVYSRIRGHYWDKLDDIERMNADENLVLRFLEQGLPDAATTLGWEKWFEMWR